MSAQLAPMSKNLGQGRINGVAQGLPSSQSVGGGSQQKLSAHFKQQSVTDSN